jgi:hypothetical protein
MRASISASCASMIWKKAPLQNTLGEITANSAGVKIDSMATAPKPASKRQLRLNPSLTLSQYANARCLHFVLEKNSRARYFHHVRAEIVRVAVWIRPGLRDRGN